MFSITAQMAFTGNRTVVKRFVVMSFYTDPNGQNGQKTV